MCHSPHSAVAPVSVSSRSQAERPGLRPGLAPRTIVLLTTAVLLTACNRGGHGTPSGRDNAAISGTSVGPGARSKWLDCASPWPTGLGERELLLRMRAHYREASRAAQEIGATASSATIRDEAAWLVRIYDHVADHFTVSLTTQHNATAAHGSDLALNEFTVPSEITDVREREQRFADEIYCHHSRLLALVRTPEFADLARKRELLREIQKDIETSQAAQVTAFHAAVFRSAR